MDQNSFAQYAESQSLLENSTKTPKMEATIPVVNYAFINKESPTGQISSLSGVMNATPTSRCTSSECGMESPTETASNASAQSLLPSTERASLLGKIKKQTADYYLRKSVNQLGHEMECLSIYRNLRKHRSHPYAILSRQDGVADTTIIKNDLVFDAEF